MIITISGMPGSGKTSVAKYLAKKLKFKHYSVGDFMREMAIDNKVSLKDLSKLAEKKEDIDKALDEWQINLGRTKDNFVIDSRLGFYFIPNSFKVRLDGDVEERARRISQDKRQGEKKYDSLEQAKEYILSRQKSEKKRYKKYYNLDYENKNNFDIVVDTTNISISEVGEKIIGELKKRKLA